MERDHRLWENSKHNATRLPRIHWRNTDPSTSYTKLYKLAPANSTPRYPLGYKTFGLIKFSQRIYFYSSLVGSDAVTVIDGRLLYEKKISLRSWIQNGIIEISEGITTFFDIVPRNMTEKKSKERQYAVKWSINGQFFYPFWSMFFNSRVKSNLMGICQMVMANYK